MQRLAEKQAREQGGDEGRGPEYDQHIGDGRMAEGEDERHHAARQRERARQQRSPGIADVDPDGAALPGEQRQNRGNKQHGTPK